MNKLVKRLLIGTLAFATILTALPVTAVHASGNQYWTESAERVGYIEHVMNDGSIKSTFNMKHEWIIKFLKLYIKDPNIIGLVKKYLKVGVLHLLCFYKRGSY